jgi:hypothetical protein
MTKIIWPENLIEELAYRRAILFLGSGVSATAKNDRGESPDTWGEFLNKIKTLMRNPTPEDIKFVDEMLEQKNYLLALQAIYDLSDPGAFSKFLRDAFSRGNFKPSSVHRAIKKIDSKIVITTNFDKIYDNLCNEEHYVKYDYRDTKSIVANIKSPQNIIIKAHGTIDDTGNLIFTSQQYFEKQELYPEFYTLLRALFITHTVLFIGYSLSDPDINLVLQSISNTSSSTAPHYIVLKEGTSKHIIKHWEESYNIRCLEYGPNYENLEENILELQEAVSQLRAERGIYE